MHRENLPIEEVPELSVPQTRPTIPATATAGNYNDDPDYVPEDEVEQRVDFKVSTTENNGKKRTRLQSGSQSIKSPTLKSPPPSILKPPKMSITPRRSISSISSFGGAHRSMTMDELENQFNGISMQVLPLATSAGLGAPILMGYWQEEDEDLSNLEPDPPQNFIIIRAQVHNLLTEKMVKPRWVNERVLEVINLWPKYLSSIPNHVGLQANNSSHQFDKRHNALKCFCTYLAQRGEKQLVAPGM